MKHKKHSRLIIPIFVPQSGCPHQCVFCNQEKITSKTNVPTSKDVRQTIHEYLETWKGSGEREIAFYGGTFTSIDFDIQERLLSTAHDFIKQGLIDCLRISTRPDAVDETRLNLLKKHGVTTIELGVQSMNDNVLKKSGRGHSSNDVKHAVKMLKENSFKIGIQIMPGLPGDTAETILDTAYEVINLTPDFARIYPTLVIKDTPLEKMFLSGIYKPWGLKDMVLICKKIKTLFDEHEIPIIRIGLQATEELRQNIAAGPFHPSFRQLLSKHAA